MGPQTAFADALHAEKYRQAGESFEQSMWRLSNALSDGPLHRHQLFNMLGEQRFLPAGRIQSAVGSQRDVTAFNCFVSGTIDDSYVDGHGSIMNRAVEAAATMRMGGGNGYDFSPLRPRGALINKLQSSSSGPVSFMEIYNAVGLATCSAGHRRGAQMAVLRIDHPDIREFVAAKQNRDRLTGFNISVAVPDSFMEAVSDDKDYGLTWGGRVHGTIRARDLWSEIMRSTWDWAEPGILFIDTINRMNNLWYCERIAATNPCAEQPLPPHGACLLGSFNLVKYLSRNQDGSWKFDQGLLEADIPAAVRAMDNVIDHTRYPLREQEQEAKSKRRMGLGVTGVANALEALGSPYGSYDFLTRLEWVLNLIMCGAYRASVELAREKGPFPLFDRNQYGEGEFIKRLPVELRKDIIRHGIRNSHLLSIAPTGTISLTADNVSSGIEPVFSYLTRRTYNSPEGERVVDVQDYGSEFLGVKGRRCHEVSLDEHLKVLEIAQQYVDSSVSKTCNVPADTSREEFAGVYMRAWLAGCKGCTTFQVGGKRAGILESNDKECQGPVCETCS